MLALELFLGGAAFFDASVREAAGTGAGDSGSLRWQRLRGKEHEKAGTAPSSGAGLMPAPSPPLCSGL